MAGTDFPAELSALDKALTSIEAVVEPATKKIEIAALSEEVSAPDLWDDVEDADDASRAPFQVNAELWERLEERGIARGL